MEGLKEKGRSSGRRDREEGGAAILNRCGHRVSFSSPNCTKKEQESRSLHWITHHAVLV